MDIFLLYLFTRVDVMLTSCIALAVVFGILTLGSWITWADTCYEDKKKFWSKKAWKFLYTCLFFWGCAVLIPSQKSLAIIAGGHLMFEAVTHPVVSETAGKLNTIIQHELDQQVKEIKEKAK